MNRNQLIKSYGFVEKVASNKQFLREHLESASKIGDTYNGGDFEGSGIGLATCKRILDSMNANYSVQSELGKGTIFYFDFPDND